MDNVSGILLMASRLLFGMDILSISHAQLQLILTEGGGGIITHHSHTLEIG